MVLQWVGEGRRQVRHYCPHGRALPQLEVVDVVAVAEVVVVVVVVEAAVPVQTPDASPIHFRDALASHAWYKCAGQPRIILNV